MTNRSDLIENSRKEHASVSQTIINMAKTCMGTGCLALPFAAREGGILLHTFGLLGVGLWNVITVERLSHCYDLVLANSSSTRRTDGLVELHEEHLPLKQRVITTTTPEEDSEPQQQPYQSVRPDESASPQDEPPKGTTTLVKLAWYATGQWGANILDVVMVFYLIGVIVTYLNAMRSFLADTVFTTGIGFLDSFLLAAIVGPLSVVQHTGRLAKASAFGLLVLLATFLVIAFYGFFVPLVVVDRDGSSSNETEENWQVLTSDGSITTSNAIYTSMWFPKEGIAGVSNWFGCVAFSFGIAPLAFNFRQAMQEPHHLVRATWWAMLLVACSYVVIGVGLLFPFPDIDGDVLHELPSTGWLPTMTRLAMVLVVLVTAPLLVVPCGELVEGKLVGLHRQHSDDDMDSSHHHHHPEFLTDWHIKAAVRLTICLVCAAISSLVPGFVNVLSFVGCCCVALCSFCLPPFLHLILSLQKARPWHYYHVGLRGFPSSLVASVVFDVVLLLWGLLATMVSTIYTFREITSA